MINIEEIVKMKNIREKEADIICSYKYIIFYGLGYDLKFRWNNFIEWFGKPTYIIDKNANDVFMYEGIPVVKSFVNLSDEIKNNSIVLICAPSFCNEIYNLTINYIEAQRIVKYPTLIVDSSKNYKKFILKNSEGIKLFYNTLYDDKSREIFEDWLKGKITGDISYYCRNCIPNNYVNTLQYPIELLRENGYESDIYYRPEACRKASNDGIFNTDFIKFDENEVYFDCGAAHGDTYQGFISAVKNKYDKIVLFEPAESVYIDLKNVVGSDSRVLCMKCGVSDKDDDVFVEESSELGGININETSKESKGEHIKLRSIDSVSSEFSLKPTFIKMDIEGAELDALKGAENVIKAFKPKLAICIYHKNEDIIDIPNYIQKLDSSYKMYVRHFDCSSSELVLFCV